MIYLPILADLEENTAVGICKSGKIDALSGVIRSKHFDVDQVEAIRTWRIGRCGLKI